MNSTLTETNQLDLARSNEMVTGFGSFLEKVPWYPTAKKAEYIEWCTDFQRRNGKPGTFDPKIGKRFRSAWPRRAKRTTSLVLLPFLSKFTVFQ